MLDMTDAMVLRGRCCRTQKRPSSSRRFLGFDRTSAPGSSARITRAGTDGRGELGGPLRGAYWNLPGLNASGGAATRTYMMRPACRRRGCAHLEAVSVGRPEVPLVRRTATAPSRASGRPQRWRAEASRPTEAGRPQPAAGATRQSAEPQTAGPACLHAPASPWDSRPGTGRCTAPTNRLASSPQGSSGTSRGPRRARR
jgi:hypothetical protein